MYTTEGENPRKIKAFKEAKTMNERTARQISEMKKQTIGVEVEMNSITRQAAAKTAAEYFGTGRFEDTARRNGYSTWSAWDAQGRQHQRTGCREDRAGHPDPPLRGHRDPAGALPPPPQGRSKERRHPRLRSPHPHRSKRPHTADPPQPREHHGKPRRAPGRRPEA